MNLLANCNYSEHKSYKGIATGIKFNKLTVLRNVYRDDVKTEKQNYWECLCECGNKTTVLGINLTRGRVRSCGCLRGVKKDTKTISDYPELDLNKGVLVEDGLFLVFENEQIFRVNGKSLVETSKFRTGGRGGKYKSVTATVDGEQKHYYVHRLMAEAFIPNPEDKPQVNHKDGDPRNNSPDNLEWVTAKENNVHAHETGLIRTLENTPHNCIKCKGPVMKNGSLCAKCKYDLRALKSKLLSKQRQRNKYRNIDTSNLKPLYQNIIKSRFRGDTLQEIGDRTGVTREYIRQLEKRVLDKDSIVYMVKKLED